MSTFEKFVRAVQPWIFSRRYPRLKVEIEPQTRARFDELKAVPTIVCPNHCRHEDGELLFLTSILVGQKFKFLAAREMFNSYFGFGGFVLRQLGCFEVNRGGDNPDAIRATEHQLTMDGGKVVIFPEGEIGYDNDHVGALEPGAAAIGLDTCIRLQHHHEPDQVCILPLALSYQFDDAEKVCNELIARLESRLSLAPNTVSLFERVKLISDAFLLARERELGLHSGSGGDRSAGLAGIDRQNSSLQCDGLGQQDGLDQRVAKVFFASLQKLGESVDYKIPNGSEKHQLHHLQAKIFAKGRKAAWFQKPKFKQLENETLKLNRLRAIKSEEFAETSSFHSLADLLCNLDVLITGRSSPGAPQTVVISAAQPLQMNVYVEQYRKDREPTIDAVTEELRVALQEKLQEMRQTHSLSDLGGSSLTLRNNI